MGFLDRWTKREKYNPESGKFEKEPIKELTREEQMVPQTKRELRKHNKARDKIMYQSLKPKYDEIYAQESIKVIKERAKRDARLNYGRTKAQKRRDAIQNLVKGVSSMGDVLSGEQPKRSQAPRKKGQGKKKSHTQQAKRKKDPFDIDLDFDFNL